VELAQAGSDQRRVAADLGLRLTVVVPRHHREAKLAAGMLWKP